VPYRHSRVNGRGLRRPAGGNLLGACRHQATTSWRNVGGIASFPLIRRGFVPGSSKRKRAMGICPPPRLTMPLSAGEANTRNEIRNDRSERFGPPLFQTRSQGKSRR
jgi:hypothetical protein